MNNFISKVTNNLPSVGGATGAIIDTHYKVFHSLENILAYMGYCIIGALIGYIVKSLLDMFDADKRIKKLSHFITDFDKKKEKQEAAKKYHEKLALQEEDKLKN